MDGRSNVGIKKAEKVFCMVLAMLMAMVITINVSAGESISKAKIDEYLYTIAYSQQEQVKEPIYGSIDGESVRNSGCGSFRNCYSNVMFNWIFSIIK